MTAEPLRERRELAPGSLVIADLHLDPAGDRRIAGFTAWLASLEDVPTLVILGDLFDVWVGPAQARMAGSAEVLEALAQLAQRGTELVVVPGNRDFLLGRDFEHRTGARVHDAGFVGLTGGAQVLFIHGDELCTLDRAYQRMKRVLRSRPMGFLAPRLPLGVARWAAGRIRGASQRSVPRKPVPEKSMQADACRAAAIGAGVGAVVCGHAHEFRDERLAEGPRWIVLDAWGGARAVLEVGAEGALTATAAAVDSAPASGRKRPRRAMIVAIDGPAASGKSTVARGLARALDWTFLDTGAMYRAVTLAVNEAGIDSADEAGCSRVAEAIELAFDAEGRVLIDGEPGEPAIRSAAVTENVSAVAAHPGVRAAIVPKQQAIAATGQSVVAEGRDTTTVVFPAADVKFFLVASSAERARRRALEEGQPERAAAIEADLERRDRIDSTRATSPLVEAPDAIRIDTDGKDPQAVLAEVKAHVLERVT